MIIIRSNKLSAKLDEPMGVSTNKQYINLTHQMILSDGFQKLVKECKLLYNEVTDNFRAEQLHKKRKKIWLLRL